MNPDAEEQLLQEAQAASQEECDLPLENQHWWKKGEDWMWQPQDKLREWHERQWASLRRWK